MSFFSQLDEQPNWAVDIPDHWRSDWLKWSVQLSNERPTTDEQDSLPYISNEDIASWTGKLLTDDPQPSKSKGRKFQVDDVLFNKLRPYLAKVHHGRFKGLSSSELLCLRPSSKVVPRFLFYVLVSKCFIDTVNAESFGAKMPRADWEIVGHQPFPLPPLETQKRIVAFLDEKTAQIDKLIEKKRALLETLAEKRQAFITRAVIKGCTEETQSDDEKIPLKWGQKRFNHQAVDKIDSMTTIPGQVQESYSPLPIGWRLEKLKFFAKVKNSNVDKKISEDEKRVSLCNYTDVYYNDYITRDLDFNEGSATKEEIERFQLKQGQVIITKDSEEWDDIGVPALVTENMPEVLCGYHLSVFETGADLDGSFLAWLCRSAPLNNQLKLSANGVTRFGLGQYPMKNAFITLPPLETQRRIARFLDKKMAQIANLVEKITLSIEALHEYRSALITAAVTGQTQGLV